MIDQQRVTLTRADIRTLFDRLEIPEDNTLDDLVTALRNAQQSASDDVAQVIITIQQGDI